MECVLQGSVHVIPIIVRPCLWQASPIRNLAYLPLDGEALSLSHSQDETVFDITKAITRMFPEDNSREQYSPFPSVVCPPPPTIDYSFKRGVRLPPITHNAPLGVPPPRFFGPFILFLLITLVIVTSISSGIFSLSPLVSFVKASSGTLLFLSQMVLLTASLCLLPTITHWITKQRNRLVHLSLESLFFLLLFVGFSVWILGRSALGNWILYAATLVLLLEAGSNFVEWNKDATLNRLSRAITFQNMTTDADAIKKLFRHEVILYAAIIVGVVIGIVVGLIRHQVPRVMLLDCLQCVLLLASLVLLYFLGLSFQRMCDPLFQTEPVSAPEVAMKNTKDSWFAPLRKLPILQVIVPPAPVKPPLEDPVQKELDLASDVSQLRRIYKYDALHNAILVATFAGALLDIQGVVINVVWLVLGIPIAAFLFSELPYAMGQYSLHEKVLERWTGTKHVDVKKKLDEYAPLFPSLPILAALTTATTAGGLLLYLLNLLVSAGVIGK
jgi:hypothetical protein